MNSTIKMNATISRWGFEVLSLAVLIFLTTAPQIVGKPPTRELTEVEARELIAAALGPDISYLPHFGLEMYTNPEKSHFVLFEATAQNSKGGSPVIGHFAVNRATGNVWDLVVCKQRDSEALKRLQNDIRKRIRLGQNDLRRLSKEAPCEP